MNVMFLDLYTCLFSQAEIAVLQARLSQMTVNYQRAQRDSRHFESLAKHAAASAAAAAARSSAAAGHQGEGAGAVAFLSSEDPSIRGHFAHNHNADDSDDQLQFRLNGLDAPGGSRHNGHYHNSYLRQSADGEYMRPPLWQSVN